MKQILVTIEETQPLQSIENAIRMLRGVVSTSLLTPKTRQEKQEEYVNESLTKAMREVKLAELEGRSLQSLDDFLDELEKEAS